MTGRVKREMTAPQCEAAVGLVAGGDGIHWPVGTGQDYCCCCLTGPTGFPDTCCCCDRGRPQSGYCRQKRHIPKRRGFRGPLGSGIVMNLGSSVAKPYDLGRACVRVSVVDTWVVCTRFLAGAALARIAANKMFKIKIYSGMLKSKLVRILAL